MLYLYKIWHTEAVFAVCPLPIFAFIGVVLNSSSWASVLVVFPGFQGKKIGATQEVPEPAQLLTVARAAEMLVLLKF